MHDLWGGGWGAIKTSRLLLSFDTREKLSMGRQSVSKELSIGADTFSAWQTPTMCTSVTEAEYRANQSHRQIHKHKKRHGTDLHFKHRRRHRPDNAHLYDLWWLYQNHKNQSSFVGIRLPNCLRGGRYS